MKRLLACALALASLLPSIAFGQVQPVPKIHTEPLYWLTARNVNTFPYYTASVLHGMGVESDTLGIFSLADAVPYPGFINTGALAVSSKSDSAVAIIAKIRFEADTITTTSGGAVSAPLVSVDTMIVQIFQGTWMPALVGNQTQPVTPARWKGKVCFTARINIGSDSTTSVVEVPIPNHVMFGPANLTQTANITFGNNAGAPQWTVGQPTHLPGVGANRFYAVVTNVGGVFPAIRASIQYYRLE